MAGIVGKRLWFFLLSALIIVICVVSLSVFGLKTGLDFSSGSVLTLSFEKTVAISDVTTAVTNLGYTGHVETDQQGNMVIRTTELTVVQKNDLKEALTTQFGTLTEKGFESVDPIVAKSTAGAAVWAVAMASIAMLIYVSWAFHRMPKPFHYGTCAVVAILHDIIVVLGIFSILGVLANWEIDLALVTGMLTVVGYAINDAIVVFDRIRENVRRYPGVDFEIVVNNSLMETMSRSLITGAGVIFVLIALMLFVGPAISNLAVVLLVGVLTGTYTSICIAAPLLVTWEKHKWGRLFPQSQSVKKTA
ncbi:MAG: protein translocase subunit SecF [Dehalococcoidales bacterium]|nr:protein translocase subunit SecF [Dehalococcoidales bacterium]